MWDLILEGAVILLPTFFALAIELIEEKYRKGNRKWRWGVLMFGVVISLLTLFQIRRAHHIADKQRKDAIVETSKAVSESVSQSVTQNVTTALKGQYESTITNLRGQITMLQGDLAEQGKKEEASETEMKTSLSNTQREIDNLKALNAQNLRDTPYSSLAQTAKEVAIRARNLDSSLTLKENNAMILLFDRQESTAMPQSELRKLEKETQQRKNDWERDVDAKAKELFNDVAPICEQMINDLGPIETGVQDREMLRVLREPGDHPLQKLRQVANYLEKLSSRSPEPAP